MILKKLTVEVEPHDGGDNLLTQKDARNNTCLSEYDHWNLRTKFTYSSGSYEQWMYDAVGNAATYRTRAGNVLTFTYDRRNRETLSDWSEGQLVIVYCTSLLCPDSLKVRDLLIARGFSRVGVFKAGWAGWRKAGQPIESS